MCLSKSALFLFLFVIYCIANSKPDAFEDTYGDLVDAEKKNIQNGGDYVIYDYVTEDSSNSTIIEPTPEIKTKPQNFTAQIGEVVSLPCEVTSPNVVLVWRRESELLYQEEIAIQNYPNIKKTYKGLVINITSDKDYGRYACRAFISASSTPEITHEIIAPAAPVITFFGTPNGKTVFNAGEILELSCISLGIPKPTIYWYRNAEKIALSGEKITIPNLEPQNAGVYKCLADNGVTTPVASKAIEIKVESDECMLSDITLQQFKKGQYVFHPGQRLTKINSLDSSRKIYSAVTQLAYYNYCLGFITETLDTVILDCPEQNLPKTGCFKVLTPKFNVQNNTVYFTEKEERLCATKLDDSCIGLKLQGNTTIILECYSNYYYSPPYGRYGPGPGMQYQSINTNSVPGGAVA